MGFCADEPRALPWAGMNDALGVSAQLYPVLLASGEDLTQRRRESQRIAESSASLRFSAFLCTICEDLRSPRKFSWPHVTFATHLTHLTLGSSAFLRVPLRLCVKDNLPHGCGSAAPSDVTFATHLTHLTLGSSGCGFAAPCPSVFPFCRGRLSAFQHFSFSAFQLLFSSRPGQHHLHNGKAG